ncbi:hypothetical protein [Hydrogenimonas sp.]
MKPLSKRNLRSYLKKGLIEVKKKYRYTDDYAWDAATNFGKETEWSPAYYAKDYDERQELSNKIGAKGHIFENYYLTGACLFAEENGIYTLSVGFESFNLRIKREA